MPQILPLSEMGTITPQTTPISQKVPVAPQTTPPPEVNNPAVPRETKSEVDPNFLALSKKEKQLLRRDREISEKVRLFEQEKQKYKPWEEASQLALTNKFEALKRLGITYDDLTALALNQTPPTAEEKAVLTAQNLVKEELKTFTDQQQKKAIEDQQRMLEQARTQIQAEAKSIVKVDNFPLVFQTEAFDTISELVELTFHETGRVMPVEEAIQEVEQHLEEEALKLVQVEKIRSKLLPKEEPKQESVTQPIIPQPKTLTHKTTVAPTPHAALTASEKRARAIKIFNGEAI